jgi:mono/diheme cytochrome c family protein
MKRLLWIIPLALIVIVMVAIVYIKFALPDVGPAPDIKVELTKERLERGEYLANTVMACVDCHSNRDLSRFAGPVTGVHFAGGGPEFIEELGAPGDFYAPNLTPYHLKDWTDGEIYRAITAGVARDGRALFPAMPAHLYGQASKEDIYAVIAYLRTLPSYENTVPPPNPKFPFSLIMNTIPKKIDNHEIPPKENIVEYGKYMITIAGCVDCHTPMEKGKYNMEMAYAGSQEFILPTGIVRSSNITPDFTTGIGGWTEETFLARFKIYSDSSYVPPAVTQGFNTIMPWTTYTKMEEYDLKAIFAYLKSLDPINNQVVKFSPN